MGLFVVLEGVDGCGKDTQARRLAEAMRGVQMSYPSDAPDAVSSPIIRKLLSSAELIEHNGALVQMAMLADHYEQSVRLCSSLQLGDVVSARYWLSGVVYGQLHGVPADYVATLAARLPQPDFWVLLDVPLEVAMRRLRARAEVEGLPPDGYEQKEEGLGQVIRTYQLVWSVLRLAFPTRYAIVDGVGNPDVVAKRVNDEVIACRTRIGPDEHEQERRGTVNLIERMQEIEVLRELLMPRPSEAKGDAKCSTSTPNSSSDSSSLSDT